MIYRRTAPKIRKVKADLPVLIPITAENRKTIAATFGDELQKKWLNLERAWILAQDWTVTLYTDEGVITLTVKRGAITDLNSIPAILESILKRDEGLVGALVHDAFYAVQFFSFKFSNCVFYQLNRIEGVGWLKSWLKWLGVTTKLARNVWDKADPDYEQRWYTVSWMDKER